MTVAGAALPPLRVALGKETTDVLDTGIPVLSGEPVERLFGRATRGSACGRVTTFESDGWLIGGATVPLESGLETAVYELYLDMLHAARGLHLARIWNYVPAINETGAAGLENYRLFCRARARAFEQHHGDGFKAFLPAASAVGRHSSELTLVFAASPAVPRHIENPMQVPAYDYPLDYGPRAPSFARATVVSGHGRDVVFVSGTAAIRGHATIAPHQTLAQLECTLENLRAISDACGLGPALGASGNCARQFKVYLRHAADQPAIAAALDERLLTPGDLVTYLRSDICRAPLNVEIEATLWPT